MPAGPSTPHIVHVIRSAGVGGVETHVGHLCRQALARGWNVTIVSLVDGEVQDGFRRLGLRVISLGDSQGWSVRLLRAAFRLMQLLDELKPSLVHLHGIRPIAAGSVASAFAGVRPVVSTLHGSYSLMAIDHDGRLNRAVALLAKLLHRVGFLLSDRILIVCASLEREVHEVYRGLCLDFERVRKRKLRVAYNSVDAEQLVKSPVLSDVRARLDLGADVVLFGTVSRLDEPKKGLSVLLEAFARLLQHERGLHLLVAGDGFARRSLEKKARNLGISDQVTFLGLHDHPPDVYRALDVFVMPSFSEGFPTVVLEAMAFSCPVVATDVGGCAEMVDAETGYLVPPGDSGALSRAMAALLGDVRLRQAMGARGRAKVISQFSVARMADAVFAVDGEVAPQFETRSIPDRRGA
jgi:glycosyltransferase involved in cell wall biosynthesis